MERDLSTLAWSVDALNDQYNPYLDNNLRELFKQGLIAGLQRCATTVSGGRRHHVVAFNAGYKVGLTY